MEKPKFVTLYYTDGRDINQIIPIRVDSVVAIEVGNLIMPTRVHLSNGFVVLADDESMRRLKEHIYTVE